MNTTDFDNLKDRLDEATAERLAKLRSMPVDTSRLDARLRGQLPLPPAAVQRGRYRLFFFRPVRAAAAGFLILGLILAAVISSSGGPAMASADRLARVHEEMVSGTPHAVRVASIQDAAAAFARQWPKAPDLPALPDDYVMSCCVHEIGRKKMACVSLLIDNTPVTLAVADSADIKMPEGTIVVRNGMRFHVQSADGVNMAMTERDGRWVCLMGGLPTDRLVEIATGLQF